MADFLDVLSPSALANLQKANTELTTMIRNVATLTGSMNGLTIPSNSDAEVRRLNADLLAQQQIIKDLQKQITSLANARQQNNTRTSEEIVNQRTLAQNADRQTRATSALVGAYANLNAQHQIASTRLQDLVARGRQATQTQGQYNRELRTAQRDFDRLNQRVLSADRAVGRFNRNVGNYPTQAIAGIKDLIGAFGIVGGVSLIAGVAKDIFQTTKELQSLNNALKQVTDTQANFIEQQEFLARISDAYGVELKGLTGQFTQFYVSAKNKISGKEIQQIFESVTKAGASMGLSIESQERAFLALNQMMSKGTIQAEELRGQLGEALPGAFGIMAKAMGVNEKQLSAMMKSGDVLASEVLPKFAKQLEITYGIENVTRIDNLAGAQNRLSNAWRNFVSSLDEDGNISKFFSSALNQVTYTINSWTEFFTSASALRKNELQSFKTSGEELAKTNLKNISNSEDKSKYANDMIISLQKQKREIIDEAKKIEASIKNIKTSKDPNINDINGMGLRGYWEKEVNKKGQELARLNNQILKTQGLINGYSTVLEKKELPPEDKTKDKQIKQKREKIHLDFAEVESQYALKLAILERQKAEINDRVTNEKAQLDDRLKAREEFSEKSIEILKLETDKEKELLLEKYNDDLNKNNLAYKNKDITAKEWATNIGDIQNRFNNEKSKSDVVYSTKWEELMREDLDFFKKIQQQKKGFSDAYLDDIYKKELELSKKSADNQDLTMRERQEAYEKNTRLQQDYNEELRRRELLNQVDLLQVQEINKRYDDLNNTLIATSKIDSPLAKAQKDTDKFIDTFTSGQLESGLSSIGLASAKMFLDFDRKGETTFDKLFAGAEKFAVTFSAIADIAKDVFSYISEQSNKNFENELNNLTKQKEVAILFAGDSASARDEIERQYDVKQREIRRRQAKAEKEQAKFSIIINTAQAIVGYLAKQQYGFALVAAAIGAVQLGVVSAQKLPEFWKGTDNAPEGWALTQEKGREIITDSKGRIKSKGSDKGAQLTYLNKGDKVFTNSETLMFDNNLNNILSSNGISSSQDVVVNNANLERKLDELINVTFNKPVPNLSFINGDFRRTVQSGHTTQIIENKRINFQGQKV